MKHTFRIKHILAILICTIIVLTVCTSCILLEYKYRGEKTDLYTVAVNNIFGIFGYTSNGEIVYDPEISVIETDKYGRTLFFYNENCGQGDDYGMAFVIMQKSDDGYAYYYQDDCYAPFFDNSDYFWDSYDDGKGYVQATELSTEIIDDLKEKNDWDKEIDLTKCTKTKISGEKPEGKLPRGDWFFEESIYSYAKANGYLGTDDNAVKFYEFCNADSSGKELYYVYCMTSDEDVNGETVYGEYTYAVIVEKNYDLNKPMISEYGVVEIKDPSDYYELVMELKSQNNWQW